VACQLYKPENKYLYLLSSPDFNGHDGINMVYVIYGKSPGTSTCTWVEEDTLTLDTARLTIRDSANDTGYIPGIGIIEVEYDPTFDYIPSKDKVDLLEVPPLRVSRKNIVK
jgi:hypothetical protein